MTRTRGLLAMLTATVALGVCLAAPALASAAEPSVWWGVSSGARPTNLAGGTGSDEVFHLSVSATAGDYVLFSGAPFVVEVVPFDASATVVQEKLRGVLPSHALSVAEEPSGEPETHLYTITFPSQQGVQPPAIFGSEPLVKLFAEFVGEEATALSGGKAEVSMTQVQEGVRSEDEVFAVAQNRGFTASSGKVTLSDVLPAGLRAVSVSGHAGGTGPFELPAQCSIEPLECTFSAEEAASLPPFEILELRVKVVPSGVEAGAVNTASVAGGGAVGVVSAPQPLHAGSSRRFGIEDWRLTPEEAGGATDTQAGSHPFQLTNVTTLNTQTADKENPDRPRSVGLAKEISGELPPGLLGNPSPFTQCTDAQFSNVTEEPVSGLLLNECPNEAAVGVASLTFNNPFGTGFATTDVPLFNMTPRHGEPARFGFKALGIVSAFLDAKVRTGGDYGVTITSSDITQAAYLLGVRLTFWGVPGDPRHDEQRGWSCLYRLGGCPTTTNQESPPFLVMPTSCGAPFSATVHAASWGSSSIPAEEAEPVTYTLPEGIAGCNHLPFEPSLKITPDGTAASTPSGLSADVHVPQASVLQPHGLAEAAVKDITVALPEGMRLNPAGADGLEACSEAQVALQSAEEASCPNASKIASVAIKTPLLPNALEGFVYLASPQNFAGPPQENPFSSLIAMYLVAKDPVSGVLVKLPGQVSLTETGQVTASFKDNPELPFEDAELKFFGGDRAPLATPAHCGSYTTSAVFAPWSGNDAVNASADPFKIESGTNGSPCASPLVFAPSLAAGTTNINAGSFTPLSTTISRPDGNQDIQSVVLHMPAGVSGLLAGVVLCPEAQANAGTCGPGSLIGETVVSVGLGGDPFSVTGGKVYLTEKYGSAPFGLSIVNPAKAGPFDLGKVVVRARVDVDPTTAALTVSTDPSGAHAIPQYLRGIPLQIKHVNVTVNRPGFTFNPTSCSPMAVTGSIGSAEGATAPVSYPFQVTNCASLKFTPKISVTTAAKTSKVNGSSLHFKIAYPKGAMGSQSWFNEAKFDLPKQLPARLTTIQKACLASVFEANPSACPAASRIGHAVVHTQVLPVPLEGPVYFVSHGGAKFPDAVLVLKGYGVSVNLVGETFISKTGLTSATFRDAPDVPFESIEVTIPSGPFSEFGANLPAKAKGSFCGQKLIMPTFFKAQNGLQIKQTTKLAVTGCPKAKKKHHARRHKGRKKK